MGLWGGTLGEHQLLMLPGFMPGEDSTSRAAPALDRAVSLLGVAPGTSPHLPSESSSPEGLELRHLQGAWVSLVMAGVGLPTPLPLAGAAEHRASHVAMASGRTGLAVTERHGKRVGYGCSRMAGTPGAKQQGDPEAVPQGRAVEPPP